MSLTHTASERPRNRCRSSAPGAGLSFVQRIGKKTCYWCMPPTNDSDRAYVMGQRAASEYVQHLVDNPSVVGMSLLGWIAADMAKVTESDRGGYSVAFFSFLERRLHEAGEGRRST